MGDSSTCPVCSSPLGPREAARLWDGRDYCAVCLDAVCPGLADYARAHADLQETVPRGAVRFRDCVRVGFGACFILVVFLGFFMLLLFRTWDAFLFTVCLVSAFCVVAGPLATLAAYFNYRRRLPRTVRVRNGLVTVRSGKSVERYALGDCAWFAGSTAAEDLTYFLPRRRVPVLKTPDGVLACGLSDGARRRWSAFLALAGVARTTPFPRRRVAVTAVAGLVAGAVPGACLGYVVGQVTGDAGWAPALALLLGLDGLLTGCMAVAYGWWGQEEGRYAVHSSLLTVKFVVLACFVTGYRRGFGLGHAAFFVVGALNGLYGYLACWLIQRRVRASRKVGEKGDLPVAERDLKPPVGAR